MKMAGDEGFTVLETLVALTVLAVASIMFAHSVSAASTQVSAANRLLHAVSLGEKLLAETDLQSANSPEGIDPISGLVWTRQVKIVHPGLSDEGEALVLVTIDVFRTKTDPSILNLSAIKSGAIQK